MLEKSCPDRLKQHSIPMSRGSVTDPLACALFEQETVVRATIEALFQFILEKHDLDPKPAEIVARNKKDC